LGRGLKPRPAPATIRGQNDLSPLIDYIHFNPVKHGWAWRAADWTSSFHRFVRQGPLHFDWGGGDACEYDFGEPHPDA
jgi:putative transposase